MNEFEKITQNNYLEYINNQIFENKIFSWIDFSGSNFSWKWFNNCKFEKCNLSNISLINTCFNNVEFIKCKILWLKFNEINKLLSHFGFDECVINLCIFYWMILKWIKFWNSDIKDSDFTLSDLSNSDFSFTDLEKTIFSQTNLKNVNFKWAINYIINPQNNKLNKAIFSRDWVYWLLLDFDIILD